MSSTAAAMPHLDHSLLAPYQTASWHDSEPHRPTESRRESSTAEQTFTRRSTKSGTSTKAKLHAGALLAQDYADGLKRTIEVSGKRLRTSAERWVESVPWARVRQAGFYTASACALSIIVGLACAATITPWFLALTLPATNATTIFTQLPLVGPIITGIVQRGGPLGALSSSMVLWFNTRAMFSKGTLDDRKWDWALAAVATGFALSTIFVPAVPVSGALAAGSILSTAVLGYLTSRNLSPQGNASWRINLMAVATGLAFAPMGAQAALLVPHVAILGEALIITNMFALGIAVHALFNLVAPLFRENVAAAQNTLDAMPSSLVLDGPNNEGVVRKKATIFGSEEVQNLNAYIAMVKDGIDRGIPEKSRLWVLKGPEGCGKWTLASGIVAELGIPVEQPVRETIRSASNPAAALREFFTKCIERARVTQKPVAILIRNIDTMLAERGHGDADNDKMVNAALVFLEQLPGSVPFNLLVIATLNENSKLDGALKSRARVTFEVPRASAATLGALFADRTVSLLKAAEIVPTHLSQPMFDPMLPESLAQEAGQQAFASGLTARDMSVYSERLSDQVRMTGLRSQQETLTAKELTQRVLEAHQALWPQFLADRKCTPKGST